MHSPAAERRMAVLAQQLSHPRPPPGQGCARQATSASSSLADGMFRGRVVVITGAGKGIGEAAALQFAAGGARMVLADLDPAAVEGVAERCRRLGAEAVCLAADVTAPDAAECIATAAVSAFGTIHVLVNNAGYTWDGVVHKMSDKQWATMLDVHCTAAFRLIRAAAPAMREAAKAEADRDGCAAPRAIINISSTSGTHGNAGQVNYATAKAGVCGLTKAVAKEWGHLNVRCNAIAYGMIDTRLTRAREGGEVIQVGDDKVTLGIPGGDGLRQMAEATVPLQRIGTAEDAAGAILFLASPWSSYVTGQVLEVNGGMYM